MGQFGMKPPCLAVPLSVLTRRLRSEHSPLRHTQCFFETRSYGNQVMSPAGGCRFFTLKARRLNGTTFARELTRDATVVFDRSEGQEPSTQA